MRGTKPGTLFTAYTDEIYAAITALVQEYGGLHKLSIARGISYGTIEHALKRRGKIISADVLGRLGISLDGHKWMTKGEAMHDYTLWKPLRGRPNYIRQGRHGREKLCRGPKHPEGGAWVPLTNFNIYKGGWRTGRPWSRCKDCCSAHKLKYWTGQHGEIPIVRVQFAFEELVRRIGKMEMCRRMGVGHSFPARFYRQRYVQKATAVKLLAVLTDVRAKNEVRHKRSIRHGSHLRGRKELQPVDMRDFNVPGGDIDNANKKRYRKSNPEWHEQEKAKTRERKRRKREQRAA